MTIKVGEVTPWRHWITKVHMPKTASRSALPYFAGIKDMLAMRRAYGRKVVCDY